MSIAPEPLASPVEMRALTAKRYREAYFFLFHLAILVRAAYKQLHKNTNFAPEFDYIY
jgi:hypothetical protein